MLAKINFVCEHCGRPVPWGLYDGRRKPRDHCPYCLWSKHVSIGEEAGFPPCGAMMRGTALGDSRVVWRCTGCGWMFRMFTDDYLFAHAAGMTGFGGPIATGTAYTRHDGDRPEPA